MSELDGELVRWRGGLANYRRRYHRRVAFRAGFALIVWWPALLLVLLSRAAARLR